MPVFAMATKREQMDDERSDKEDKNENGDIGQYDLSKQSNN